MIWKSFHVHMTWFKKSKENEILTLILIEGVLNLAFRNSADYMQKSEK